MASFTFPNGFTVNDIPEDISEKDFAELESWAMKQAAPMPAEKSSRTWSGVPGEAVSNILPSAVNVGKNLLQTIIHPVDTAGNVINLAGGAVKAGEWE